MIFFYLYLFFFSFVLFFFFYFSFFFFFFFFFSSRRRHTRFDCDWSSDVCSSDLGNIWVVDAPGHVVYKMDPRGKVLLQLGTKGVAGMSAANFNLDRKSVV